MTQYLSYDIFPYSPDWNEDPQEEFVGSQEVVASDAGIGRSVGFWSQAAGRFTALFTGLTLAEIADLYEFFDAQAGRLTPFWLPAWQPSLTIAAAFLETDTDLTVDEDEEYAAGYVNYDATGRHLMFEWPDGTQLCRKVSAATPTTITLDAMLGKACAADELPYLCVYFLYFVRFDTDVIEANYPGPACAQIEMPFREIPWEAPTT